MDLNSRSAPPPPNPKSKKKNRSKLPTHLVDNNDMEEYEMPHSAGSGYNLVRGSFVSASPLVPPSNQNRHHQRSFSRESMKLYGRKNLLDETPETTIGPNVKLKGELEFTRLLRIDGKFEGKLVSTGDLIVGPRGVVIGDVMDMGELLIDGKIVGNISVEKIDLRDRACIHGNITCKSLRMDPTVMIVGMLNVHPQAPLKIDDTGKVVEPEAEIEKAGVKQRSPSTSPKAKQTKEAPKPSSPVVEPNTSEKKSDEEKPEVDNAQDSSPPEVVATPADNLNEDQKEETPGQTSEQLAAAASDNDTDDRKAEDT